MSDVDKENVLEQTAEIPAENSADAVADNKKDNKKDKKKEKKSGKKTALIKKRTINLAQKRKKKRDGKTWIVLGLLLIGIGLLGFFGVYKPIMEIQRLQDEYNKTESQLNALKENNADYNEVKAKYTEILGKYMTENEQNNLLHMDMIKMLEDDLLYEIPVKSVSISGLSITVEAEGTDLVKVSELLEQMQKDPRNKYVTVTINSSDNPEGEEVTADFKITYNPDYKPEEQTEEENS